MRRYALLGVALLATGCEGLLFEPAFVSSGPEVQFAFGDPVGAPAYGDFTSVLQEVRQVRFLFTQKGQTRDTTAGARFVDGELLARVRLRAEEASGWLEIQMELQLLSEGVLFRGLSLVQANSVAPRVVLEVVPVATFLDVFPTTHLFTALGDSLTMTGTARFLTRDVIVGAELLWSSPDPTLIEVVTGGRVVARGNGDVLLQASTLGATRIAALRVFQTVTTLTGVAPSDTTITNGRTFRLRPFGTDPRGSPLLPGANVTYQATGSVVVDPGGTVRAVSIGTGRVEAVLGTARYRTNVTVGP